MEPKKRKYYDKDETDDYLELVMEQYKQLYDENLELQKNVKSLNDGVQYYRSIENTMQKALVLAEKTAKETKDAAQLKAEAIEKDANTKADKIVAEAEQELLDRLASPEGNLSDVTEALQAAREGTYDAQQKMLARWYAEQADWNQKLDRLMDCLLYTSDAADE